MKNKFLLYGLIALALPTTLFADIVYQGKRVQEWPEEARPTFSGISPSNSSSGLARAVATQTKGHYAAPKGKIYSLTLLVDFSDKPAPVTVDEVEEWLNKEGFNRDGCNGSVRDYYLDVSNGQLVLQAFFPSGTQGNRYSPCRTCYGRKRRFHYRLLQEPRQYLHA